MGLFASDRYLFHRVLSVSLQNHPVTQKSTAETTKRHQGKRSCLQFIVTVARAPRQKEIVVDYWWPNESRDFVGSA